MMYLPQLLSAHLIRIQLEATDKWELLKKLSALLAPVRTLSDAGALDADAIFEAIAEREERLTSAIGQGCALPHARIEGLAEPVACMVTLAHGIDFGAADHEPVRTVCLLLVPSGDPAITLSIMAEVAGLMASEDRRQALATAESPEALLEYLRGLDAGEGRVLTARNIMRRPYYTVYEDTPLTEVTRLLQSHLLEATSVVNREGQLVGMVSCDLLFRFGLPDFFGQLKSVAFVKRFDPFENYFKDLKSGVARDVMTQDYAAVPEDATLLEVIFELSVRQRPKVFVVRDGKLIGIIDRIAVLNRVLNY